MHTESECEVVLSAACSEGVHAAADCSLQRSPSVQSALKAVTIAALHYLLIYTRQVSTPFDESLASPRPSLRVTAEELLTLLPSTSGGGGGGGESSVIVVDTRNAEQYSGQVGGLASINFKHMPLNYQLAVVLNCVQVLATTSRH